MFRNPIDRRRTILAVAAVNTQAASGAMYMIAYGTYFFQMAGVGKPFEMSIVLVCVGVIAVIINTLIITRFGRRRVFLVVGLTLCGLVQLILAAVFDARPKAPSTLKLLVGLSVVYILAYNGMIAAYACEYFVFSEAQTLFANRFLKGSLAASFPASACDHTPSASRHRQASSAPGWQLSPLHTSSTPTP